MQRTFILEPNEQRTLAGLENENTRALAQIGSLMMELETAKHTLAVIQDKQRAFLRAALADRHIEQFQEARILNGGLVAELPDERIPSTQLPALVPPHQPAEPAAAAPAPKANGRGAK